jgi:hypothetical protein
MDVCLERWQLHGYKNNLYLKVAFYDGENTAYQKEYDKFPCKSQAARWGQIYEPCGMICIFYRCKLYQETAAFLELERAVAYEGQ